MRFVPEPQNGSSTMHLRREQSRIAPRATSHMLSEDQAKFPFEKGCDQVAIGSGQMGSVHLSPEAEAYSKERAAKVLLKPTPEAIRMFSTNRARGESAISRGRARAFGRGIEEVVSGVI